jgi:hypothetical protein
MAMKAITTSGTATTAMMIHGITRAAYSRVPLRETWPPTHELRPFDGMSTYPKEAEALLSAAPDDFVTERDRLARKLRADGRKEEAGVVASLRKPAPVVLAANRAARSRPQVAKDAARAAKQVKKKLGLDAEARNALDESLRLLEEVALAFLGKTSEATRRRLHDLLRNAVADDDALAALTRGVLTEEPEPAGFAAYAGARPTPRKRSAKADTRAAEAAEKKRRERKQVLIEKVAAAEERLDEAVAAEGHAARERAQAERDLEAARARLERLRDD